MKFVIFNLKRIMPLFLLCFSISVSAAYGQVDQAKLNALKEKYSWGSMYLTYIPLINLNSVLNDKIRIARITKQHGESTVSILRSFLQRHKRPSINESIAFIQIDLNRVEAGFKKASDGSGVITRIEWSQEDVVRIADLCDKVLNGVALALNLSDLIQSEKVAISKGLEELAMIRENPYISAEANFLTAKEFRLLLLKKETEISQLKGNKAALFNYVQKFKTEIDDDLIEYQNFLILRDRTDLTQKNKEFFDSVVTLEAATKKAALNNPQKPNPQ